MIAANPAGEITFYEELGLSPGASNEEIRDAFRLSVRLLHPDQHTDPQLKEIAEKQMRKLNRIYAVLSDPDSRRQYDEGRDEDLFPTTIVLASAPVNAPRPFSRIGWGAAILLSAVLLFWLAFDTAPDGNGMLASTTIPVLAASPSNSRTSYLPLPDAAEVAQLRSALRVVTMERDAAVTELNHLRRLESASRSAPTSVLEGEQRSPLAMTEVPSSARPAAPANSYLARVDRPYRAEPLAINRQLTGFWFYAKPPQGQLNRNESLYPPEYIEATITETNGVLHGNYRSRFRIADRIIFPEVNFSFTGAPGGTQFNGQWTGAGGAKGDLTLKLTSDNSMKVDWTANELGSIQGLNSGTAVLTRRIE